jgi:hypothetical protein
MAMQPRGTPIGTNVSVYRDHPEWGSRDRWFMMSPRLLDELHVCDYELKADPGNEDIALTPSRDIAWIEAQHPGCVLVY